MLKDIALILLIIYSSLMIINTLHEIIVRIKVNKKLSKSVDKVIERMEK